MIQNLSNEEILFKSSDGKFILSNYRVYWQVVVLGQSNQIYISLENISSIQKHYKSKIWLLVLAAIFLIFGIYTAGQRTPFSNSSGTESFFQFALFAAFLVLIWWLTSKHAISIASDGGVSIDYVVKHIPENQIEEIMYLIQEAKLNRIHTLARINLANNSEPDNKNKPIPQNPLVKSQLKCPSCSHIVKDGDLFCETCGNKLK